MQPTSPRAILRRFIKVMLPMDSDLDALCGDFFPEVAGRFASGMDRVAKVTLLLTLGHRQAILAALQTYNPERYAENESIVALAAPAPREVFRSDRVPQGGTPSEIIDFSGERSRHETFQGRHDVLNQLDHWLLAGRRRSYILITGSPGMGKSAILHEWLRRQEAQGNSWPHHLLRHGQQDWDQPATVNRNLAAQLEARYPEQREPEASPERRLPDLLLRIAKQLLEPQGRRLIIVIDGLDEVAANKGENPLQQFIPWVLPPGVLLLCASRPTYPNLGWLEARDSVLRLDLDSPEWAASNEEACGAFWKVREAYFAPPLSTELIEHAIKHGAGNLLYAVKLCEHLQELPASARQIEQLPRGLKGLLEDIWQRLLDDRDWPLLRRGLGLLCAAREALLLSVLDELMGGLEAREVFLQATRPVLMEEPAKWRNIAEVAYRPYHESFRGFLEEKLGGLTAMRSYHGELAEKLGTWPGAADADDFRRGYALRHSIAHRVEAADWKGVRAFSLNIRYLEAKILATGVEATEADLEQAARRCPQARGLQKEVRDVGWALRAESHWLRQVPTALQGLFYNRLVNQGWPSDFLKLVTAEAESPIPYLKHPLQRQDMAERTLAGHAFAVRSCAICPDGKRVVSASVDYTLKVWDIDSGRELMTLIGHKSAVNACAVSTDGKHAISASDDKTIKVWDLDSGRELRTLTGHTLSVRACALSLDGRHAVSASSDRTLKVWDLETGCELMTLAGHTSAVHACAMTPDGKRVLSGAADHKLKVWDLESRRELISIHGHSGPVYACAVSPDGKYAFSGSADHTLKVWDLASGHKLMSLYGHKSFVYTCAVSPDGKRLISGSADLTLKVWNLHSGQELLTLTGHAVLVCASAVSPDGKRAVSGSEDKTLKVWDLDSGREHLTLSGHAGSVSSCTVSPDGKRAISGSGDNTLKIWDISSGRELMTLTGHRHSVYACAMSPNGSWVVSGSGDHTLKVWDLSSGQELRTLSGHKYSVYACAISPDGQCVVSGSDDTTLKVWDLDSGQELMTLTGHISSVYACVVTPDGKRAVSGSDDKTLKVWNLASGQELMTLTGHLGSVYACAVSPDGKYVVSGSDDKTLKVWDLDSGRELITLAGHASQVTACAVSPDGKHVLSGSGDHTLKLWNLTNRTCEATIYGTGKFLCVSHRGSLLAAGDASGNLWMLESADSGVH